jgi:hypothetical protein
VLDGIAPGAELVDLGVHRFSDLGRPQHLWQLSHPALQREFPPLRSLDAFCQNRPVQLTPLIGRADDICAVRELRWGRSGDVDQFGRVGKTRLALTSP